MDLVLSSAAEAELTQPGGTPAAGPLQEKCCGCQPIYEGQYNTVTMVDGPLICTSPCAAEVLGNSPGLSQIAPRELQC